MLGTSIFYVSALIIGLPFSTFVILNLLIKSRMNWFNIFKRFHTFNLLNIRGWVFSDQIWFTTHTPKLIFSIISYMYVKVNQELTFYSVKIRQSVFVIHWLASTVLAPKKSLGVWASYNTYIQHPIRSRDLSTNDFTGFGV